MKEIIVRADDLGFSEGVNYGIEKACRHGIIRSVGVMTNMEASEHGVRLISDLPLCLGLHTNICAGRPLTDPREIPSICDENGRLKRSAVYRQASRQGVDFIVLEEVVREIEAQYQAFLSLIGDKPHYFEGHAVFSPNFSQAMRMVAESHGCEYLEFSSSEPIAFRNSQLFVTMNSSLPDYDPYQCLKQAVLKDYGENGYLMYVCHPGYLDQPLLEMSSLTLPRPRETAMCSDPAMISWLRENDVRVITYDELP